MKITHPDGSIIELETEHDLLLYDKMRRNGSQATAAPAAAVTQESPMAPTGRTRSRGIKAIKVNKEYASVLQTIKDFDPEPVMRTDIADLLGMEPERVSVCLAELKRLGLATNLPRPNSWKWQLTDRARTGWEVKP